MQESKESKSFRLWTYEEVMAHQKAQLRRPAEKKINWPVDRNDIQPDPGRWVAWLPSDWIQVRKVSDQGGRRPAWISPEGKLYDRKEQIEKRLGILFEDTRNVEGVGRRMMVDADANECPEYWPPHLPHDWRISLKDKNGKVSVCYYPPGDDENFVGSMADVKRSMSLTAPSNGSAAPATLKRPLQAQSDQAFPAAKKSRSGRRKPKNPQTAVKKTPEKTKAIEVSDDESARVKVAREEGSPPAGARLSRVYQSPGYLAEMLSKSTLPEFFQFLQCQLRMQAKMALDTEVGFEDTDAQLLWSDYQAFVSSTGADFFVPYHSVLGKHELFLGKTVHHHPVAKWDARQRIVATLIFRAHCNQDLFTTAQLPHLLGSEFWSDPLAAFSVGRALELSMLEFHQSQQSRGRKAKKEGDLPLEGPLLLQAHEDSVKKGSTPRGDKCAGVGRLGAVRRINARTQRLLRVADLIWPLLAHAEQDASATLLRIATLMEEVDGLGKTWGMTVAKDLDLARPDLGLLEAQEEIDMEALVAARCLAQDPGNSTTQGRELLLQVLHSVNSAKTGSGNHFWDLLQRVEEIGRRALYDVPSALEQLKTQRFEMSAGILQVQLCQYRRFRQSLAHMRLGLGGDVAMALPAASIGWRKQKSEESCKIGR